jgi:hypothetical protein
VLKHDSPPEFPRLRERNSIFYSFGEASPFRGIPKDEFNYETALETQGS